MEIPPKAFLVLIGAVLILAGVIFTPVYQPLGNTSFWLGVLLLIVGLIASIFL